MKTVVHYTPKYLPEEHKESLASLFNLVGKNTSVVDRTGSFKLPFNTTILWNIPEQIILNSNNDIQDVFNEEMIFRAKQILNFNKHIVLFYSGGLDSTSMLLAFEHAINEFGYPREQISIAASIDSMIENPVCWFNVVLKYDIKQVHHAMKEISLDNDYIFVLGENSDQLFGGGDIKLFTDNTSSDLLTEENLIRYLKEYKAVDLLDNTINLIKKAPFELKYMRELLWWINFTCKWQNVALRAFRFTDIFSKDIHISKLHQIETFFNTVKFQQLAMNENFPRFSDFEHSPTKFKGALRSFIKMVDSRMESYVTNKIKVGSLYNVVKHRNSNFDVIMLDTDTGFLKSYDTSAINFS